MGTPKGWEQWYRFGVSASARWLPAPTTMSRRFPGERLLAATRQLLVATENQGTVGAT